MKSIFLINIEMAWRQLEKLEYLLKIISSSGLAGKRVNACLYLTSYRKANYGSIHEVKTENI